MTAPPLQALPVWTPSFKHEPLPGARLVHEALAPCGLTRSDAGVLHGLTVAIMHRSFLFEQEREYPFVSTGMLTVLSRLGSVLASREALLYGYWELGLEEPSELSAFVAQMNGCWSGWSSDMSWLRAAVALSKGIDRATLPPKILLDISKQLVGALCLMGEDRVARKLILPVLEDAASQYERHRHDPWSELQNRLRTLPTVDFERAGADHDARFTATLSDLQGRTATGTASSKKEAKKAAGIDYIEKYLGGLAHEGSQRSRYSEPRPIGPRYARDHADTVRRLQWLFDIPDRDRGLLSQALIHSSWSFENGYSMRQCSQRDYATLARIGDTVLQFEGLRGQALHVCTEQVKEFRYLPIMTKDVAAALAPTRLEPGVLLGRGESGRSLRESVAAEVVQAVIAAVYLGTGAPDSLREVWPPTWDAVWHSLFPETPRQVDPSTALLEHCGVFGVGATYSYTSSGPDHDKRFACCLILAAKGTGEEAVVVGAASPSKTAAKHAASALALEACLALARPTPDEALSELPASQVAIGRFLLRAQVNQAVSLTGRISNLQKFKVLGAHFTGDLDQLMPWAEQTDAILAGDGVHEDQPALATLYRSQSAALSRRHEGYLAAVTTILAKLIELEHPEQIDEALIANLSDLCEIGRALGTDRADEAVSDLLEEHQLLARGKVTVQGSTPLMTLLGNQAAAVSFLLKRLSRNSDLTVQFSGSKQADLHLVAEHPVSDQLRASLDLWARLFPSVAFTITGKQVDVRLLFSDATATGPIMRALQTAFCRDTDPFYRAVADLLHDAKNQITAARAAAASPADSVSDDLERQLAARRHFEAARSHLARLQTVVPGAHRLDMTPTDVGAFLRTYCRDLVNNLPSTIGLSIPSKRQKTLANVDRAELTAVLDNLVKNAVEAMPDGGRLSIAWTADEDVVMIEVVDDGPGMPESILAAIETDRQLRSRKHHGNGIGLLSTKLMLHRIGGELTLSNGVKGCVCLIQLPIFDEAEG